MLSRPRTQPFAQTLLLIAMASVIGGIAVVAPERVTPMVVLSGSVVAAGAVVMLCVWLARPTRGLVWIAVVPLVDLLACIPLREAAQGVLAGPGFLVLFPLGWLAFAFPLPLLALGLLVTGAIPLLDVAQGTTPSGWLSLVVLPFVLLLYSGTIVLIARDLRAQRTSAIDARTRMADALRSSATNEATMRALGDATPGALVVFDRGGRPLLVNATAREWTRRAGVVGALARGRAEVYLEDRTTRMPIDAEFLRDLGGGEYAAPRIAWVGRPGEQVAVSFVARPVVADGEAIATILVGNDVTELLEAVDVRDRFLDTVGHELRSPLTVIMGHAQLADAADDAVASARRWDAVERAAERLLRTVDRLIAAGRTAVETSGTEMALEPVVRDALREVREQAVARGLDFAVVVERGARATIAARDLAEIVTELASNAVRFTPPGGSVVVDVRREGSEVLVEVADTGVGMTDDERRQAFDRFFRGQHAYVAAVQGAGLGLSIARVLAAAHGATIELAPHGTRGTVATLRLPAIG